MNRTMLTMGLALWLCGCQSQLRHYKVLEQAQEPVTPSVGAYALSVPQDEPIAFLKGLSDRAQAALVKELASRAGKEATPSELLTIVSRDSEPQMPACSWAVKKSIRKRIVFTVSGSHARQADRIDRLNIALVLPDTRAEIVSWDRFDTKYDSYNLGSATYTQSGKLGLGKEGAAATAELNSALQETVAYSMRRVTLGGNLTNNGANILLEGGPLVNLFGNFSAVVSLQLATNFRTPSYVHVFKLSDAAGISLSPANTKVERCQDLYPEKAEAVIGRLSGSAIVREVLEGADTVTESDDRVKFTSSTVPSHDDPKGGAFTLLSEADLTVIRYGLGQLCAPAVPCAVYIEDAESSGRFERVALRTPAEANALHEWLLKSQSQTLAKRRLLLANAGGRSQALTPDTIRNLQIRVTGGNTAIDKDI